VRRSGRSGWRAWWPARRCSVGSLLRTWTSPWRINSIRRSHSIRHPCRTCRISPWGVGYYIGRVNVLYNNNQLVGYELV
jgi:hypothetical protein